MSTDPPVASSTRLSSDSGPVDLPRYHFVQQSENVNASSTRRAMRSHAMKAVRRQQRQEVAKTILQQPSSGTNRQLTWPGERSPGFEERQKMPQLAERIQEQSQEGGVISGTPIPELSEPAKCVDEYHLLHIHYRCSIYPSSEEPESFYSLEKQESSSAEADEEVTTTNIHARTLLGAGKIDPFQTSPVRANQSLSELLDHYLTVMPATFIGVRCRKPIHIDMYRVAICHRASIHAVATLASKSLDFLRLSKASRLTLNHTMRAVQAVNEGLLAINKYQTDRDDGIILAILLLVYSERGDSSVLGRNDIALQHWVGLREVVRHKGGFGSIRCNHSWKAALAWSSSVWGVSRYSKVIGSPDMPSLVAPETPADLRQACRDFIGFFFKLNDNAYSHSVHLDQADSSQTAYPYKISGSAQKQSLFAPGTPLYRLLGSNFDSSMGFANQRASDACQRPCLLYINAVLLEYASAPHLIDDCLAKLINAVYEDNLDTGVSPEHLLHRLLIGTDGTDATRDARLCRNTRLVYVAKRLGKSSIDRVRSALWRNLALSDGQCRKERLFAWDPVMLEAEILRD